MTKPLTKMDHALALAELGFHVFRIKRNEKRPFAEGWQEEATRDPEQIRQLFEGKNFNIGIFTEIFRDDEHLVVVDIDTKEGKRGLESLAALDVYGYDLPPTWEAITASGGIHKIYTCPHPLKGGANKLGTHIDIKSYGGYIVAAGSTIGDAAYRWDNSKDTADMLEPTPAPQWLIERLGRGMERTEAPAMIDELDTPAIVDRAIAYLKGPAPEAVKGAGRNNTNYIVACKLRDYGCSETMTLELMWEHYNPHKVHPAYEWERVEAVVEHAYRFAKDPQGKSNPNADFTDIPREEIPQEIRPPASKLYFLSPTDIQLRTSHKALIKDLLDPGAMSVLYGESNTGKTFVAMDIAYHVATGAPFDNRPTMQGPVLYIAAEAGRSAENRILALRKHYNDDDFPLYLVPCPVNLFDSKADAEALKELIDTVTAAAKNPLSLIVIDTLSRVLSGGNENSSEDMGALVANFDKIRHYTKAHVMIVHHSGKDTAKGARGHSLLRAATDTELEVADNIVTVKKQRDMEFSKPIGFELDVVELALDAYGERITSCIVRKVDPNTVIASRQIKMEPRDLAALLALKSCRTGRTIATYENVTELKEWAQACKDFNMTTIPNAKEWPVTANSFNVAFKRARDRLVTMGMVEELGDNQWVSSDK